MKQFAAVVFFLMLLTGCDVSFNKPANKVFIASDPGTEQQQRQVHDAAVEFLTLLDANKVAETWTASSPVLKEAMSEAAWVNMLKAVRLGLGSFKERSPAGIGFTQAMPDAPAGNYCVIEFNSVFATTSLKEKVIVRDENEQWKVVGYYVSKSVKFGDANNKDTASNPSM